jgi:flagellar M-ring protein FliF
VARLGVVALAVCVPLLVLVGVPWLTRADEVPLFAGLGPEETQAIIAQLQASRTPYRLVGDQLMVPADKAAEVRLRVASQGLPIGGGVGFEVFDRTALGVSDFTQRLNYQRALQGELARTIGQLHSVSRARVHLVLPQASLFAEREKPASASVFLKLAPGARLNTEQVRGIVHLVASSVEGLAPERVTVIDTAGRVLLTASETGTAAGLSPRRLEMKTAVEEGLERRVQSLLDAVLGPGQAAIRVSAQINLDQRERTEERFDPNPVIRQETRTVESAKGSSAAPLPLPVAPPNPGAPAPAPPASTTSNDGTRESESVSYELSKVVARTLTTPGEVQRLTVAVLLNARPVAPREGGEARPGGRPAEEVEKIRRVVMGAVGFDAARGDEVTVVEMPFEPALSEKDRAELDSAPGAEPGTLRVPTLYLAIGTAVVVLALIAVWMTRRRGRAQALAAVSRTLETAAAASTPTRAEAAAAATADAAAGGEGEATGIEEFLRLGKERKGLRQRAVALAAAEPEATAQLLRAWMVKKR